jgi:hypothetical protein
MRESLQNTFQYESAIEGYNYDIYKGWRNIGSGLNGMVNPNLDANNPVILCIFKDPSHAVLCDGYGYNSSTLYHHFNMGWSGNEDAWYNLPIFDSDPFSNVVSNCVYNIFASGSGEIISGRVMDKEGKPIRNAEVTAQGSGGPYTTVTNSKGIYALKCLDSNSTYTITVTKSGYNFTSQSVKTGKSRNGNNISGNRWGIDFVELALEDFETGDFSKFPWEDGGAAGWTIASRQTHSGTYSANSGVIKDGESSVLKVTLDCMSGHISFWHKVSSQSRRDYLNFCIDGEEKGTWSGIKDWAKETFDVTEGIRTFEWTYSKDGSKYEGDDTVWIDDIEFPCAYEPIVIDDFESYTDFTPDRIFDTWIDGRGVPGNGSQVGYAVPPFAEQSIVHGGLQSMPFFYNNNSRVTSEAERTFAIPQDWTVRGAKALTLWFRGNSVAFQESPPGTFTISGSGADIWGTADQFCYVYKQLSGNGSIVARVLSVDNTDPWAKAGVMIRETLEPGSKFAAVYITPGNGCRFQIRNATNGSATSDTPVATAEQWAITSPYWVKIERTGYAFKAYYSSNPATDPWHLIVWSPQMVGMQTNVYTGLALTSHQSGVTCLAKFSDVSTTGAVTGAWQVAEFGVAQPSNKPAPLYVTLKDSANKSKTVKHPDSAATNISTWTQWDIDIAQFTGVNPQSINKMIIGVGDKENPKPAAGIVYFDDIQL